MQRALEALAATSLLLFAATPGMAKETDGIPIPSQGWSLGVGANNTDPGYVGYHSQITPFPFVVYRYKRLYFTGISVGYMVVKGRGHSVSPQSMAASFSAREETGARSI